MVKQLNIIKTRSIFVGEHIVTIHFEVSFSVSHRYSYEFYDGNVEDINGV